MMRSATQPRPVASNKAPVTSKSVEQLVAEALRGQRPPMPDTPPWSHRLLPPVVRRMLADLGLWANPVPQSPSRHLEQTLEVLRRYGWCQSLDTTITGRLCIRGAQNVLAKTGHVTPEAREKAVAYMQQALAHAGITMTFFTWNDLPDQQFSAVETLLTSAARLAHQNGE